MNEQLYLQQGRMQSTSQADDATKEIEHDTEADDDTNREDFGWLPDAYLETIYELKEPDELKDILRTLGSPYDEPKVINKHSHKPERKLATGLFTQYSRSHCSI